MMHALYLLCIGGAFGIGYFCGSDDIRTLAWKDRQKHPPRLSERRDIRDLIDWSAGA